MNNSELDRLMHAVLDGEATPAEARELDQPAGRRPVPRANDSTTSSGYSMALRRDAQGGFRPKAWWPR